MNRSEIAKNYFPLLLTLLLLFVGRVVGQLLVANFDIPVLPPMEQWQSGLLPYPVLVFFQLVIIGLFTLICVQFKRCRGYFVNAHAKLGRFLSGFGRVYVAAMIIRYIFQMIAFPDTRWFGGCLPIAFHFVLASFILTLANYQKRVTNPQLC